MSSSDSSDSSFFSSFFSSAVGKKGTVSRAHSARQPPGGDPAPASTYLQLEQNRQQAPQTLGQQRQPQPHQRARWPACQYLGTSGKERRAGAQPEGCGGGQEVVCPMHGTPPPSASVTSFCPPTGGSASATHTPPQPPTISYLETWLLRILPSP